MPFIGDLTVLACWNLFSFGVVFRLMPLLLPYGFGDLLCYFYGLPFFLLPALPENSVELTIESSIVLKLSAVTVFDLL